MAEGRTITIIQKGKETEPENKIQVHYFLQGEKDFDAGENACGGSYVIELTYNGSPWTADKNYTFSGRFAMSAGGERNIEVIVQEGQTWGSLQLTDSFVCQRNAMIDTSTPNPPSGYVWQFVQESNEIVG